MAHFRGVYVAVITPFSADGRIDDDRLREHLAWLIECGVHGIVPAGSCGEYASLSDEERAHAVEIVADACRGRVPVVVGTGASSTAKAVHWAQHARECGAAGIMALPPTAYRPSRAEVRAWYAALDRVGLPTIAYNNPFDTTVDLTPDLLSELCELEHLVAVKEYSGDVRRIPLILERTRLEVIVGCDDLALEGLLAGATGWIAGLTNVVARESMELYSLVQERRMDEARALYARLLPLFRYDSRPTFVQAIKFAFDLAGKSAGTTRPPRLPLPQTDRNEIAAALEPFVALAKH
ncbi:MAG: dihydrodipicolinate synthase family protein [Candidatus Tyrphobacter sp.]